MAIAPDAAAEARKRERQRQLEALAIKAAYEKTDGAVEAATTIGVYLALAAHLALVAIGAWLLTRGGSTQGFSSASQLGAGLLMFDGFLCLILIGTLLRAAVQNNAVRALLIAAAIAVALTALPTVFVSLFGEMAGLPFRRILYVGKGGLMMFALLGVIALYGAASVWLAWRLAIDPAGLMRLVTGSTKGDATRGASQGD